MMQKHKILVVDDDPISRMLIGKILEKQGYAYQLVDGAIAAFEALSCKCFSLILMDIEMPDTDGLEATRFIRQLNADYFANIPVVALTAHKRTDVFSKASAAGMTEVLSKPIDVDELLAVIQSIAVQDIYSS